MATVFIFCALIGGTFLICQLVMTLIGMGHEGFDTDVAHAAADALPASGGEALHGEGLHGEGLHGEDLHDSHHHGSSWFFGIISFRTLVAAMTVFGLAGMTAHSGGVSLRLQLLIAVISGGAAMLAVHQLMRFLYRLGQSGTLRITNAIGKIATVSIPIPGNSSGPGKVRLTVQGRLEELAAVNSTEATLVTGSQVIVVDVVGGNVLEVVPLQQTS